MTPEEARVLVGRLKGSWPRMYLVDDGLDVWLDYFSEQDFDLAVAALRVLSRERPHPPAVSDFVTAIEGQGKYRFKCPVCGIGWPSQARCDEHVENIHE